MDKHTLWAMTLILLLALAACGVKAGWADADPVGALVPVPGLVQGLEHKTEHQMRSEVLPRFLAHDRRALPPGSGKGSKALTGYDMIAVDSEMTFDPAAGRVAAVSHAVIESVQDGLNEAGFWLEPMESLTVKLDDQELVYAVLSGYIVVTLPDPLAEGEQIELEFTDQGAPDCSPGIFGMTFCNLDEDLAYFGGCPWVPAKLTYSADDLMDSKDLSFSLTIPEGYVSAASADLLSVEDNGDGTFTHNYESTLPGNDVNFAFAPFDVAEAQSDSGVPSRVYTLPGHQTYAQAWADLDADVIDFYEQRYRDYLYSKIDAIQVLPELRSGLATLSAAFIYEGAYDYGPGQDYFSEGIFAHEIGHEWWAFMVPLREYVAPWLNEGFTEFSAYTFSETIWGQYDVDYAYNFYGQMITYTVPASTELPLSEMGMGNIPDDAYFLLTYQKGAYVMRMLRHVLGDEDFYAGMRTYAEGPGTQGSTTDLFQQTMEQETGQELDWFFDQWAWGIGWPHYKVDFAVEGDGDSGYTTTVTVSQEQDELFEMPVPIVLYVGDDEEEDSERVTHVERIDERSHTFSYQTEQNVRGLKLDPRSLVMARREPALTGDINGSGDVDGRDLAYLAFATNAEIAQYSYNWIGESDLNFDGVVDAEDLALLEENFGKEGTDE